LTASGRGRTSRPKRRSRARARFGSLGETVAKYTAKGRPVAVDGRLEWREWENDGAKRQAIEIIADSVQFLGRQAWSLCCPTWAWTSIRAEPSMRAHAEAVGPIYAPVDEPWASVASSFAIRTAS
jgi:single-stranded DNA-binding protein